MDQEQKAHLFQALHVGGSAFLLPNAWDALSASVMEQAGFPAIATASAAIALSHGVADGEALSRDEMMAAIRRIVNAVSVPVTADIEGGYGRSPDEVAETVRAVIEAGAVGINIEDSVDHARLRPVGEMCARITAARQAAEAAGLELYINARADAGLIGMDAEDARAETLSRAKAYVEAGASGIFVITREAALISEVARTILAPLNVLAMDAQMPSIAELSALGVRRISTGPRLLQAAMGALSDVLEHMQGSGGFEALGGIIPYDELEQPFRD